MKETTYKIEKLFLSPYAAKSIDAGGREHKIDECKLRTEYQRDRDRIVHCKSFRRLKHKTQVFLSPEGDHYRTRLTHTLEVAQIARTIARALLLNEDLAEAIALGHDLGHTPFGHAGERALSNLTGHFEHNEQSLRVVEVLEEEGNGLNLTILVRDGILNHKRNGTPHSLEGMTVKLSDRIAYLNHDIDDGIRAGILKEKELPRECREVLGNSKTDRINNLIYDIVNFSEGKNIIAQSPTFAEKSEDLWNYMNQKLYSGSQAKCEEGKAENILQMIYSYYHKEPNKLPSFFSNLLKTYSLEQVICDYIAGMTDTFAITEFQKIYVPVLWKI